MNQDTISGQGIDFSNISEADLPTVLERVANSATPAEVAGVGQDRLKALNVAGFESRLLVDLNQSEPTEWPVLSESFLNDLDWWRENHKLIE
jgi:hypothetical protein